VQASTEPAARGPVDRVVRPPQLIGRVVDSAPIMSIVGIDHVQIAIPAGSEDQARAFYVETLGLNEIPKPPVLAVRGGVWLECGRQQLHLGIERDFRPARKAHPGLIVDRLSDLADRLIEAGYEIQPGETLPGLRRLFVNDPFGNRIELVEYGSGRS
jgi:catechol 2,3-dioxygenase-like lactoylglutathione lyase family enzyme